MRKEPLGPPYYARLGRTFLAFESIGKSRLFRSPDAAASSSHASAWVHFSRGELLRLIDLHGAWGVFALVAIECIGIPLPGESALLAAAVYAGETHRISIEQVITAAAAGGILGSTAAFAIGKTLGFRLLCRYGRALHVGERGMKLGLYLFRKHGGGIVFFGRFISFVRALAALLAGTNQMPWARFSVFNVGGAIVWAVGLGLAGYSLGASVHRFAGIFRIVMLGVTAAIMTVGVIFFQRNAARLMSEAERALPGPIERYGPKRHLGRSKHAR